jgi:hypothetical protein
VPKIVYIAGPFRGPSAWHIAENVRNAERLALDVWRAGAAALCPHLNTANFQGAAPDDLWLRGDLELLSRCDAVLLAPGWERSEGARAEYQHARSLGLPVFDTMAQVAAWLT